MCPRNMTTLGPGRCQNSEGHAAFKIMTSFIYGLFYDTVSSSGSVHVGKNELHNRQRESEDVRTKCKGHKSSRPPSAFCATVGGGGDPAPVPRCSIEV